MYEYISCSSIVTLFTAHLYILKKGYTYYIFVISSFNTRIARFMYFNAASTEMQRKKERREMIYAWVYGLKDRKFPQLLDRISFQLMKTVNYWVYCSLHRRCYAIVRNIVGYYPNKKKEEPRSRN